MEQRTRLWHPFADMAAVADGEVVFDRAEGVWVWDEEGRRYIDATASLWYCNVGHGRAELAEVAAEQMRRLAAYSTYDVYANRPALALAERVCALAPIADAVAFFTTGGSDAVETAAKLVRRYWQAVGRPERRLVVVRDGAYHGMNAYGTSLGGIAANGEGYGGELVAGVVKVPRDDSRALALIFEEYGAEIAAFFGEPVLGAGGVYPPVAGYWSEVQRLCRKHDVLLVVDEVVTGFGRLGTWFGSERYGLEPDIVIGAKGITSGYVPLGVVLVGPRVREPFWRGAAGMFRHGYTYCGHAAACAVASANLDILERERLVERVAVLEPRFAREIGGLAGHPLVEDVRAAGLLAAVQLNAGARAAEPGLIDRVASGARARGVLTRAMVGHSLQLSPPFVIEEDEIVLIREALEGALDAAAASLALEAGV